MRLESGLVGGVGQQLAQPGALPVADELLVGQFSHPQPAPAGERVIARQDHHELLGDELAQDEPLGLDPLGHRQKRQVEHVVAQHLPELLARLLADGQLDARVALVEHGQCQRHVDRSHRVHRADRHVTRPDAGQRLHLGVGGVDLGQDPAGAGDERPARLGDRDPPGGALHQREPDLLLEPADLLRQGGLGDVLARRRPREVLLVGERHEIAQLAKLHKLSL